MELSKEQVEVITGCVTKIEETLAEAGAVKHVEKATVEKLKKGKVVEMSSKSGKKSKADLDAMTYNDLKAYAKTLGVKAIGNRDKITDLVLEALEGGAKEEETSKKPAKKGPKASAKEDPEEDESEDEDSDEDAEYDIAEVLGNLSEKELKFTAKKMKVKLSAKDDTDKIIDKLLEQDEDDLMNTLIELGYVTDSEEDEDSDEESEGDEDSDENNEEDEQSLADEVEEALKDYSDKELKDLLDDAGISSKGKRSALLAKIVKGIEDDVIEWGDSDEDSDDSDEDSEDNSDEDNDDSDEDDGDEEVTEEREAGMKKVEKDIRASYKAKKLKDKEVSKFLDSYYEDSDSDDYDPDMSAKEKLELYIQIQQALVDDEGEIHDLEDAYVVNGENYCCGQPLEEVDGKYVCQICGAEYED